MCDYSLEGYPNRLAKVGDELVLREFPTSTKGFCPKQEPVVLGRLQRLFRFIGGPFFVPKPIPMTVVCIPPGARLQLSQIPHVTRGTYGIQKEERVVFTQTSVEAYQHRDAVRFSNGTEVRLQRLPTGLLAKVVSVEAGTLQTVPTHWPEEVFI